MKININNDSFKALEVRQQKLDGWFHCVITQVVFLTKHTDTGETLNNPFFNIHCRVVSEGEQKGRSFRFCLTMSNNEKGRQSAINRLTALLAALNLQKHVNNPTAKQVAELIQKNGLNVPVLMHVVPPQQVEGEPELAHSLHNVIFVKKA